MKLGLAAIPLPVIERVSALCYSHFGLHAHCVSRASRRPSLVLAGVRVQIGHRRLRRMVHPRLRHVQTVSGLVEIRGGGRCLRNARVGGTCHSEEAFQSLKAPALATPADGESQGDGSG